MSNIHYKFMRQAIENAQQALVNAETPVGCLFVHNGEILANGANLTKESRSVYFIRFYLCQGIRHAELIAIDRILENHRADIFKDTDLYVTVEPCIMCASALRQLNIRRVFFACANERFGGCGSILSINKECV